MGICTSTQKAKPAHNPNQSKITSQATPHINPTSSLKQEFKSATRSNEINPQDSKIVFSNIKPSHNEGLNASLKTDGNNKNSPSWIKNNETPHMQDNKLGLERSYKRQNSGSWLRVSAKIDQEIPQNPVPKAFHHPGQPSQNIMHSSLAFKNHHQGVTPILEHRVNSQSDEASQRVVHNTSIKQQLGVQSWARMQGFSWQNKVQKVSLIY